MRIVRFFAKFTIILLIVVVGAFLVSREILLMIGTHKVATSLSDLVLMSHKGSYASSCRAKGVSEFSSPEGPELRLRFISDTEYVLEVNLEEQTVTVRLPEWDEPESRKS